ncbi:MAG: tRNA-guanine transglycosylase, partial [Gammaproteobacteria bacterium]
YLSHLYRSNEVLAAVLNTHHNLHYYLQLMSEIRDAIAAGCFNDYRRSFYARRDLS